LKKFTYILIPFFFASFLSVRSFSQAEVLPTVFFIGEHEDSYQRLTKDCNDILLSVCQDSMDVAYAKWLIFLSDVESYAKEVNFDINGIKIWINVYWSADGKVQNIAYYPKPNCRNMNFEELTAFFEDFSSDYEFSLTHESCFSQNSSASFPTFAHLYRNNKEE